MLQLARPEDRIAINQLAVEIHGMHVQWRPDIFKMESEMWPQQRFDDAVAQRQLFVEKDNEKVLGYALIKILNYDAPGLIKRKVLSIDEFGVIESCRNCGIGTEMMIGIRAIARAFGCSDMQLNVYPQNNEALAFYQKCGFRVGSVKMQVKV